MKKLYSIRIGFCFGMAFLFLSLVPTAFGQDEGEVPQGSTADIIEAKAREKAEEELKEKLPDVRLPKPSPTPEKEGGQIPVFIKRITVKPHPTVSQNEFDSLLPAKDYQGLVANYEGKEITYDELNALNQKIEELARSKGLFAVARIPPQEIENGELEIEVLFSRMGELSLEGNRYFRKKKTLSYWDIPPGRTLQYDEMVQSLIRMNENPDRIVKPLLQAGSEIGTTDIILKSIETFPLHPGYSFDNQGVKLTGKERQGLTLRHNNLLTLDDIFLIGTAFGNTFGALFWQHIIPLNDKGTKLTWGFSHAQVNPKKEFKSFGINGISQTYQAAIRQKVLSRESLLVNVYTGFAFKEKRTRALSVTTTWDRLRVLSFGGDLQKRDQGGIWAFHQDSFVGFSPHGDGFALNSRQGETRFFKLGFGVERRQKMPFGTELQSRFEGQLSHDKLTPQEQYFLGGESTVRGYPESDYGADQAVLFSSEYLIPCFLFPQDWKLPHSDKGLREQIHLISFFDYGYGRLRDPSATESHTRRLIGVGGGFSIQFRDNLEARFEWGAPIGENPITEAGKSQFHFRFQATA